MSDKFKITYEVSDGYAGGARPQYCYVDSSELWKGMEEDDVDGIFHETIQQHYDQHVSIESKGLDDFKKWVITKIDKILENGEGELPY